MLFLSSRNTVLKSLAQTPFLKNTTIKQTVLARSGLVNRRTFFGSAVPPTGDHEKTAEATRAFIEKISKYPTVVEKFSAAQEVFVKKSIGSKNLQDMSAWESIKFLLDPEIKQSITEICDEMKKTNIKFDKEEVQALFAAINSSVAKSKNN